VFVGGSWKGGDRSPPDGRASAKELKTRKGHRAGCGEGQLLGLEGSAWNARKTKPRLGLKGPLKWSGCGGWEFM